VLIDELQIILHLAVNGRLESVVIEFKIAAPTIEVFRIVVERERFRLRGYGRGKVITIVAFEDFFAGKVLPNLVERPIAEQALKFILAGWSHSEIVKRGAQSSLYYTRSDKLKLARRQAIEYIAPVLEYRMRILQVCSAREIGGGERHLADLANALARREHDVYAALVPSSPLPAELSGLPGQNILELPMRNSLNIASAFKLARFVRANQIEIVHAHVARDYPLAALAAGRGRPRLVLTRHVLFPLNRIHKLTLRRVAHVIAVSQAVADSLRAQHIFRDDRIVVIHNGIDVERFNRRNEAGFYDRRKTEMRVGMIGHLAPIKGQEDFIHAATIVCAQRSDVNFIIAGEDKSRTGEYRRNIEQLIRELGLDQRIRLTGWMDDVAELLSTLDLFVSPSRSEPFGLAIVEAMAAGVPVIATTSEGAREIIDAEKTGRLVPIGDVGGLANAMCELLDNPKARQSFSANGQRAARERFSLAGMVKATEDVYRRTLE